MSKPCRWCGSSCCANTMVCANRYGARRWSIEWSILWLLLGIAHPVCEAKIAHLTHVVGVSELTDVEKAHLRLGAITYATRVTGVPLQLHA